MSEKREMPEGTTEATGACRFCGQMRIVPDGGKMGQGLLDEYATNLCECDGARGFRAKEKKRKNAAKHIERIFGKEPEIADYLIGALPFIIDGSMTSMSVKLFTGIKGDIRMKSDGKIAISRSYTMSDTEEA